MEALAAPAGSALDLPEPLVGGYAALYKLRGWFRRR